MAAVSADMLARSIDSLQQFGWLFSPHFDVTAGEVGWHRIRVDMYEKALLSGISVWGTPPGGGEVNLSAAMLSPGFDRVTSQTVLDDGGAPSITTVTDFGTKPWLGLPVSTTVDPGGLNLTFFCTVD